MFVVLQAGEEVRLRSGTQTAAVKVSDLVLLDSAWIMRTFPGTVCCTSYGPLTASCRDNTDGHFVTGSWFVFSALALSLN